MPFSRTHLKVNRPVLRSVGTIGRYGTKLFGFRRFDQHSDLVENEHMHGRNAWQFGHVRFRLHFFRYAEAKRHFRILRNLLRPAKSPKIRIEQVGAGNGAQQQGCRKDNME